MAIVAVAVTLGTPNSVGQVPITVNNLAASIADAVTDTATLAADIVTAKASASAADVDADLAVTAATTADTDAAAALTLVTTADTSVGTTGTNFDAFAAALIAITGDTYNSTTKQFTFGGATGLTHAQIAGALGTALNLVGANNVTAKAATASAKTSATTADTAVSASLVTATTTAAATETAKDDANDLSTTAISADLAAAQGAISDVDVYVQLDTADVTNVALLNGALVNILTFIRDGAILPT